MTLFNRRYIPVAVVVDHEFLTLPVVIAVAKERKLDAQFLPKCILQAFAEFFPEAFALDKLVVIVVESDKYFRDIGAELVKLRFSDGTTCTIFKVAVFPCARLIHVINIMGLGCWNVLAIKLTSFPILDCDLVPVIFGLRDFWICSIWEKQH